LAEEIKYISPTVRKISEHDFSNLNDNGFVKVGFRSKYFLESAIIVGRERSIVFPDGKTHKSFFAIVELDNILASHNENNFASTKGYPTDKEGRNVNDRNYATDKNAQARVMSVAENLNPNIIISTNATASGTPIVSVDGIVVSGNNRTMSLKLAKKSHPEVYLKYKKTLQTEFSYGGFGLDSNIMTSILMDEDITLEGSSYNNPKRLKINNPILVRIDLDFSAYTSTQLNIYNKSTKKSEKEIDIAIRLSQQLKESEGCSRSLVNLISELDSVGDIYTQISSQKRLMKILLDCNIITENDISSLFTEKTITKRGKDLYEAILLGLVLDSKSIEISQKAGVKSFTNNVVNAIIPLIKNQTFSSGSLINEVNNAMRIKNAMVSNGYSEISQFITEKSLFDEAKEYKTNKAIILASFISDKRKNRFKDALSKYNNSVLENDGANMFGDALSVDDIFKLVFTDNVNEEILKALEIRTLKEEKNDLSLQIEESPTEKIKKVEIVDDIIARAKKYL